MPIRADHRLTPTLASIVVVASAALALAGGIAIAGETGTGENAAEPDKPVTLATEPIEACMAKWDPGTHMTKEAWRQTCLRIKEEREPYVQGR
jgi:hypothetical protein